MARNRSCAVHRCITKQGKHASEIAVNRNDHRKSCANELLNECRRMEKNLFDAFWKAFLFRSTIKTFHENRCLPCILGYPDMDERRWDVKWRLNFGFDPLFIYSIYISCVADMHWVLCLWLTCQSAITCAHMPSWHCVTTMGLLPKNKRWWWWLSRWNGESETKKCTKHF